MLDVGCGLGALTIGLARVLGETSVAAVDPGESAVETCRARVPEAEVIVATAENLPFDDGAFDAALAQLAINLVDDPAAGAREMRRVVRAEIVPDEAGTVDEHSRWACGTRRGYATSGKGPVSRRSRSERWRPRPATRTSTTSGSRSSRESDGRVRSTCASIPCDARRCVRGHTSCWERPEAGSASMHVRGACAASCPSRVSLEALCRTRTGDPFLTMEVLYQLS